MLDQFAAHLEDLRVARGARPPKSALNSDTTGLSRRRGRPAAPCARAARRRTGAAHSRASSGHCRQPGQRSNRGAMTVVMQRHAHACPQPVPCASSAACKLLRLLGKSERTMAWRAATRRASGSCCSCCRACSQPMPLALERWQQAVRKAARLNHPQLAAGRRGRRAGRLALRRLRPARQRHAGRTTLPPKGLPGPRSRGAGDAGAAGPGLRARARRRAPRPAALPDAVGRRRPGAAGRAGGGRRDGRRRRPAPRAAAHQHRRAALRAQREAAERDVLAVGVLLHGCWPGEPRWTSPTSAASSRGCRRRAARSCACRGPRAHADARAAARHRQPRHRPPAAPALPQRTHAAACAGRLAADRGRRRRRAAGAAARPPAQRRRAAVDARRRGARCPAGADGARAHQRAGRSRAAGPGAVLRDAAAGQQRPRCAARRWPAAARC